jgi:hypothetical protein
MRMTTKKLNSAVLTFFIYGVLLTLAWNIRYSIEKLQVGQARFFSIWDHILVPAQVSLLLWGFAACAAIYSFWKLRHPLLLFVVLVITFFVAAPVLIFDAGPFYFAMYLPPVLLAAFGGWVLCRYLWREFPR